MKSLANSFFRRINADNILLASLLIIIFIIPITGIEGSFQVYRLMHSVLLITAAFSLNVKNKKLLVTIAALLVVREWIPFDIDYGVPTVIARVFPAAFFAFIVFWLVKQTASAPKVTKSVIIDSISGYLLIGVLYSIVVFAIIRLDPSAYKFPDTDFLNMSTDSKIEAVFYYTFVTYTTTGYGDILPVTGLSRALSNLISVTGQLYVAIIIAILVGKFSNQPR
jgi:hypothetical protein